MCGTKPETCLQISPIIRGGYRESQNLAITSRIIDMTASKLALTLYSILDIRRDVLAIGFIDIHDVDCDLAYIPEPFDVPILTDEF